MFAPALAPTVFVPSVRPLPSAPARGRNSEPVRMPSEPRASSERMEPSRRNSPGGERIATTR